MQEALHSYADEVKTGKLVVVGAIYGYSPGTITVTNLRGEHELAALETQGNVVTITPFEIMLGSKLVVTVTPGVKDLQGTPFPRTHQTTVTTIP